MTTPVPATAPPTRQRVDPRAWVPSLALASVVGAFLLATPPVTGHGSAGGGPLPFAIHGLFAFAGGLVVTTGVVLGRRFPGWATLMTLVPFLAVPWMGGFVWGWWLGVLAVAVLAALEGVDRAALPTLASVVVVIVYCGTEAPAFLPIGPVTSGTGPGYELVVLVMYLVAIVGVVGIAAAVGSAQRSRRREEDALAVEQHALTVESLAAERARLARDLHDVVAHHVSLVAVRAESAPFVHPGLDDDARAVLAAIALDAREALTELRQVLVVLQRTGAAGESERAPQPTACDVDSLVASAVAAGQPVTVEGTWSDVAAGPGYVLYRAVQEGLTNARRHAPGAPTTLVRSQHGGTARFRLSNPGAGAAEPGRGLIGMRERVEALGGTMTTAVVGGKFVLDVAVPAGTGPAPVAGTGAASGAGIPGAVPAGHAAPHGPGDRA